MRSIMRKSVMLAGAFLVFAGGKRERVGREYTLEVKVPFPFVVNGANLPGWPVQGRGRERVGAAPPR